jgi:hypothetical protein
VFRRHQVSCGEEPDLAPGQLLGLEIEDKAIRECLKRLKPNLVLDRVLWLLWEVFYRNLDLRRLKKCSVCPKWFVDHSKNKSKTRCSARCTSQRWSWEARKQAGHVQKRKSTGIGSGSGSDLTGSKLKAKGERYAKAKKA